MYMRRMDITLSHLIGMLVVAIFVALLARRLSLPYTVGLVIAGIGLALARLESGELLTHDFIFDLILPPLLFEAAINIHWRPLRGDLPPVLILSVFGVAVSAAFVALGMGILASWPAASAIVFGVLIAATDPVAVIALFKDLGVSGRLKLLIESESLFNDGVAAVLFGLAISWAAAADGASIGGFEIAWTFAKVSVGGVAIGVACALAAVAIARGTSDHLVETALTFVVAYGAFLSAEHFEVSGVLATVAAGVTMGNLGVLVETETPTALSSQGRAFVVAFWDFAAFLANSLVFLLIGLRVAAIPFATEHWVIVPAAIFLVLAGRAASVYPLCLPFARSRWAVPMREQHVLWWGGLRGALALALALALPPTFPFNTEILVATFGVVTFSVIVQGFTMSMLMKALGVLRTQAAP